MHKAKALVLAYRHKTGNGNNCLPVKKWLTSICFTPFFIIHMQAMPIPVSWINLQNPKSHSAKTHRKKKQKYWKKNLKIDKNIYSFNPVLKSQFLCFGIFRQPLSHLPEKTKILPQNLTPKIQPTISIIFLIQTQLIDCEIKTNTLEAFKLKRFQREATDSGFKKLKKEMVL